MADINKKALAALDDVLKLFIPAPADPALKPLLLVTPLRVAPTGLGGYVGLNHEPEGDIIGRRVAARVSITVRGNDAVELNNSVSAVTGALIGAERATLLERGILQIALDTISAKPVDADGAGASNTAERELWFTVLYEFLMKPEAGEGIIREIPIELEVG